MDEPHYSCRPLHKNVSHPVALIAKTAKPTTSSDQNYKHMDRQLWLIPLCAGGVMEMETISPPLCLLLADTTVRYKPF